MPDPAATALITEPTAVFAWLATLVATVFWLSSVPRLKRVFAITPPVIYAYFIPTISTTLGITPQASPAYEWVIRFLLPAALLLLMITVDLRSLVRLGPTALFMLVAGSVGIVLGAAISLTLFGPLLPAEAWKGFAALAGSWIGGSANMMAIAKSVGTPDSLLSPIIVVDTVVGYSWMGVLLFFSAWQHRFDIRTRARTEVIAETNRRLANLDAHRRPLELWHAVVIVGFGIGGAVLAVALGERLPVLGNPTIVSHTTWAVLLVVTGGLLLSFTPVSRLEEVGASRIGYTALYLMMAAVGAQANLAAVVQAPVFVAAGVLWLGVHAIVLYVAARLVRAPLFFIATSSMANIGGPASAPVVAGIYHPALAPVGLLMAVGGYVLGIYGGLACAWLLSVIGG
ncbi:MAG: DUF819 family protein [Gemmatimonadales bacterium]|nr:DUF819 family protein [Gemmatimonadales bacterium]